MIINQELRNKIRRVINTYCQSSKGLSVGITNKDETIFEHYHGVINRYRTRNDHTKMIMIGSITKLLVSMAILQLEEQGLLDLDADISTYLPELSIPSRFDPADITIRLMLQHRSGLPGMHDRIHCDMKQPSDLIQFLNESELIAKPGTMYAYSNNAFVLLGLIIERITNTPFIEYINKNVQLPMDSGFIFNDSDETFNRNKGVFSMGFGLDGKEKRDELENMIAAGSSTYGKLEDLMKLTRVFLNPETQTILKPDSLKRMITKTEIQDVLPNETHHNLGMSHNGVTFDEYGISPIGHGGATVYHSSLISVIPEWGIGVSIMSNTFGTYFDVAKIRNKILTILFDELGVPIIPKKKPIKKEVPEEFIGDYSSSFAVQKIRRHKDGEAYLKLGKLNYRLEHDGDDFFVLVPIGNTKKLSKNSPFSKSTIGFRKLNGKRIITRRNYIYGGYLQSTEYTDFIPVKRFKHWKGYDGTYKATKVPRYNKSGLVELKVSNSGIVYNLKWFGLPFNFQYYDFDENTLITQGYGRHSGYSIYFNKQGEEKYVVIDGIRYYKVVE